MTIRDFSLKLCIPLLLAADCVLSKGHQGERGAGGEENRR